MPRAVFLFPSAKFSWFRSHWACMGKGTRNRVLTYLALGKSHLLPMRHIPGQGGGRHRACRARATYQRGLRLGVLPCSRRGRVVHEQIEGGVDGVFVHAAGALRGLQAWKNHSWVRRARPGGSGWRLSALQRKNGRGVPLTCVTGEGTGWGCLSLDEGPRVQASPRRPLLDPQPALQPRNLGQRFLLKTGD